MNEGRPISPNEFEANKPGTSERDAAEAAIERLRKEGGIFVDAVRATRMPMVLTDPNLPGNPIVFANEAFLKLSGYSMDDVLGQQPHFMNGPGTDPNDAARFREMIRADQDEILETVQYRKNGSRFVATVLLSAFKDDAARTLHHFMSWLDVTRRVEAEEEVSELRRTQKALQASQEQQAFLLELGDAVRSAATAEAKIEIAARMLGERLDASRVLWAEYDWDRNLAHIFNGWFADGAQPFPTVMKLADYEGEVLNQLKAGRTVRVSNVGLLTEQPAYAAIANVGVQALLSTPLLVDGKLKVNLSIHQHVPRHWTDEEDALVEEVSARLWAEVVRARAELALAESEEKYRKLFESMDEAYAVVEVLKDDAGNWADFRFLDANPAFLEHTSMPYPVGKTASELLGTPNPRWTELYGEALDSGKPMRVEEPEPTLGRTFDLNIFSFDRERNRVAILFSDITERKRSEQALQDSERHAQVLLAELQHRVRNTLAVVRSIARRTAERSETMEEMVSHFEGRLNAFARVQSAVSRNPGGGLALDTIIEDELVSVAAREGEQFRIKGPQVCLRSRPAETISLAIHELGTNAVKYGALSSNRGKIEVNWEVRADEDGVNRLLLKWVETGLEELPEAVHEGFGYEMLRRTLPYELGASTDIQFTGEGLRFTMSMPLGPDVLAEGEA